MRAWERVRKIALKKPVCGSLFAVQLYVHLFNAIYHTGGPLAAEGSLVAKALDADYNDDGVHMAVAFDNEGAHGRWMLMMMVMMVMMMMCGY
jgi:hypothetical protein